MAMWDRLALGPLKLSYTVRFAIALLAFLLSLLLFAQGFPSQLNGSVFALPIALVAWLLYRREIVLFFIATVVSLMLVNSFTQHTIAWSENVAFVFLMGVGALLTEICVIGYLRKALEAAQLAHHKAQQAEEQLAIAFERQQELNQLKDQFIVNVNHELRTPLTQVYGYLELLSPYVEQLDGLPQLFCSRAIQGCEELSLLINNILSASAGSMLHLSPQPEEVTIATVVQDVLDQFDPRTREQYQLELSIPGSLTVVADPQFLRQILRNLLANAFKYTPEGTTISISAAVEESSLQGMARAPQVCVRVKDTGCGIPPDELPLLFGKFVRLHRDLTGPVRGSGLGLHISKQLVEAMNGHIWVESTGKAGEGSCFSFTLPTTSVIHKRTAKSGIEGRESVATGRHTSAS